MKLKNISIGDFIEAKNKHGGDAGFDVLEIGKSYEVLGFSESGELTVIISVPEHKTFCDGLYACHEFFRKPKPQLKQLDQSVFNGIDEKWRFAAVDSDGAAFAFVSEPARHGTFWGNSNQSQFTRRSGKGAYDASNWQNSLIERESKELTGDDLCKAMLARGDTRIMCKVYDDGNRNDLTHVIRSYSDDKFHTKANRWGHAIPINNQGEPLTASDVGL